MNYNKENYVGRKIQLYPGDTYSKYGIIDNVDDLGWNITITRSNTSNYQEGNTYFISHSKDLSFRFINEDN